jgi:3-oxoacyl-[acyl-carrier-protein] synthase II
VGDAVEQRAIAEVFGAAAGAVAVSSAKGALGHLLGAAGAVEAAFAALSVAEGWAPPTANLVEPDPRVLGNLVRGAAQRLPDGRRAVLTNSFGFGGTNAALALASPPE